MCRNNLIKTIKIKEIIEEVQGFKSFVFEDGHGIKYKAGQYLTLLQDNNGEEVRRSYSITSAPDLNEPLAIGVKRIENGFFSRLLIDSVKVGNVLQTTGSGGLFILPDDIDNYKQLFFFAAGSGITPVYSLIKTTLYKYQRLQVVLVYSNTSTEKAIFLNQLQQLQALFPERFHLELLFSNNPDLSKARLHRDLLLKYYQELSFSDKSKILFYICGPESYMRLCTYTLQEHGVSKANIKKENFIIHTVGKRDLSPPDKEDHLVHIKIGNHQHTIPVQYPDSVLKAAKKSGIQLPYSCEAGRCGNCVAKCTTGTMWHSYNEVLTDKEIDKGLVLTCVGHPIGGDVHLEIL